MKLKKSREWCLTILNLSMSVSFSLFLIAGMAHAIVRCLSGDIHPLMTLMDGLMIGSIMATAIFTYMEHRFRKKAEGTTLRMKTIAQEAIHLYELSKSFYDQGNSEASAQFYRDFDEKRMELLKVLSELK